MNDSILILFGTASGNSEICANSAAKRLGEEGFDLVVKDIREVEADELQNESTLLICISTQGDGAPPQAALRMWRALMYGEEFDLSGLRYAVLGLGDASYKKFCQCGKDFDAALERRGAERIAPRGDCDVEFVEPCTEWIESVVSALKQPAHSPKSLLCMAH
jgi:sulfite reductase alpha subunit-like flavoprotein